MRDYIVVEGFKVPTKVYNLLTNNYGLTNLEAMLVILDNI